MMIIVILFSILLCLTGCTSDKTDSLEKTSIQDTIVQTATIEEVKKEYQVFIEESNYKRTPLEPKNGCMLGAHILSDKTINGDITKFETLTQKNHDSYLYYMRLGEPFPLTWVLECITKNKIPQVILYPPNSYVPFDTELLQQAASDFGQLDFPMLVQFYPNPSQYGTDTKTYINFFKQAREEFRKKAPNVAFVWSVDSDAVFDCNSQYPGDDYTDWIGINLYKNSTSTQDYWKELDFFYNNFQKQKPLMVSQLAVSHYSTANSIYDEKGAAVFIKNIYETIRTKYPRIKAIMYINRNDIDTAPYHAVRDNYQITDNTAVLEAYKQSIHSYNTPNDTVNENKELFRSPFPAYNINNSIFISEKTLLYDLQYAVPEEKKIINGEKYINSIYLKDIIISIKGNNIHLKK